MNFAKRMHARFAHPYCFLLPSLLALLLQGCTAYTPGSQQSSQDPPPDPPTAPANLAAKAASASQINLTWGASTGKAAVTGYRVERCSGAGCSSFAQIGTTSGATGYSDTGLSASTSYSYRVRANDGAGDLSGYSNTASASTSAGTNSTPPTAPSNLAAADASGSSTQVNLTWKASTDSTGVTGYKVERCSGAGCSSFTQVGTTSGATSYSDTGLSASTAYSYRVRATDAAGNLSSYSNVASVTTPASVDNTPPTAPTNLKATAAASGTQINLSWTASTDNVGVTGYKIERCSGSGCSSFAQIGTTSGASSYSDTGLSASTSYSYRVRATDAAGNLSGYSNIASATTSAGPDTTPPTPPTNLKATASSSSQIGLTWTASTDNVGVTGYKVERCSGAGCSSFTQIGTTSGATSYSDTGLDASTSYSYRVRATDAAGNLSGYSNTASATTSAGPDTTPPTPPTNLKATASSSSQIGLTWTASTDNVGVTGYKVERCSGASCSSFTQIGTTSSATSYSDTGLNASTAYSYRVRATDAAGNLSSYSNTASATTSAGPDTTPPTPPTNLKATASSSSQIGLTWTASTDNVGVTGYKVERCSGASCSSFTQIGTTSGATSYSDTGLSASTSYSYRVRATDAAGNLSGYSNTASATTSAGPDTTPPTPPTNLQATASSSSQIGLTWTASTDNVGVTGYKVERCSGAGCSSFTQIGTTSGATSYSDTGLSASTAYSYRVRATDAAGNLSGYSNTASATTSSSGGSSITVSVSPRRGGLTTSQQLTTLSATLTNDSTNQGVTWSFTSTGSTSGGGFSPTTSLSGVAVTFTAPSSAGVVTITATSIADGSKTATATIGITDLNGVTTYMNGNARQGGNLQEYALATSGPTAVNSTNFGKLFSCGVDAAVYAQPLWVAHLTISGASHNVIYAATQHNTLYAFDADSSSCENVWGGAKSLNPVGQTWLNSIDVSCGDIQPDIGIVSTPVIDLSSQTIYVVTKSKTTGGSTTYHQFLHAVDLTTGAEKFSGPMEITATASGNGNGSVGGVLTFDSRGANQRPALLLENSHIIISWASHCDNDPYHGWLMSYNAKTLAREAVLNLSPNGARAGIWMSGGGPAADGSGNIYLVTGNGTFNANDSSAPNSDYGDSIMKIGPPSGGTFPVLSYFTPFDQASLAASDTDQGSGGLALLPDNFLVQAGKDGNIYLANQSSLGGYNSSSNGGVAQEVSGQLPGGVWGVPTYWNGTIFYGAGADGSTSSDPMRAFSFNAGGSQQISSTPTSTTSSTKIFGFSGPNPSISSSGSSNGIVWALDNSQWSNSCGGLSSCQALYAYDATNLQNMLYNSRQAGSSRDLDGGAVKFTVATVANGKVYVGNQNKVTVYGLLP